MADFQTFDLGRILQTAAGLQASQRAAQDDVLRQQFVQGQIKGQQQEQQQSATNFTQTQQELAAKRQYFTAQAALSSPDPKGTIESIAPQFVQDYESHHGQGSWAALTPDQAHTAAQGVMQQALSVIGPQTKVKWIDNGGQQIAVDETTGQPLSGVKPIVKTASPDAQLSATTSTANNATTTATTRRGQDLEGARADKRLAAENIRAGFQPDGTLDPKFDSTVQAILDYRQPPFVGASNRGPGASIMAEVNRQDPTYDATQYPAKAAALKSLLAGKDGQTLDQVNTAVQHLSQLKGLLGALNTGDIQIINQAKQAYQTATGNPAPTNAAVVANMAAGEVNKVVTGGPGAEGDRDLSRAAIQLKGSPEQQTGAMDNIIGLMAGRLNSVQNRFQQAKLGPTFDRMLMPETKAALASHAGGTATTPPAAAAPAAPAAVPTATGPNGQKLILQNGAWVPLGK